MNPTDKGYFGPRSQTPQARNSPLRRRLTSRLQPLHGGLGFGANAIRERALVVARQATLKRSPNPSSLSSGFDRPVLGPVGDGLQFAEEPTVIRELDVSRVENVQELTTEKFSNQRDAVNERVRRSAVAQKTPQQGRPITQQTLAQAAAVPSIKSFISGPFKVQPPTLLQSLTAWFFDALVVISCLIVGFTISASVPFMSLLAHKFPTLVKYSAGEAVHVGSLGWMVLMMQTLAVGSLLVFFVQTFAGIFFSASIGRAITNVQIASSRSVLGRGLKIGFSELLQWPLGFGLLNAIVSPEHNFFVRSVRWARGGNRNNSSLS